MANFKNLSDCVDTVECRIKLKSGAEVSLSNEQFLGLVDYIEKKVFGGKPTQTNYLGDGEKPKRKETPRREAPRSYVPINKEEAQNYIRLINMADSAPRYKYLEGKARHAKKFGRTEAAVNTTVSKAKQHPKRYKNLLEKAEMSEIPQAGTRQVPVRSEGLFSRKVEVQVEED